MKKIKVHSLTRRITPELMRKAFQAVKRNRGAAGVDKVSIQMFAANLEQNLTALMRQLKAGTYRPLPLRRVHFPKAPERRNFVRSAYLWFGIEQVGFRCPSGKPVSLGVGWTRFASTWPKCIPITR